MRSPPAASAGSPATRRRQRSGNGDFGGSPPAGAHGHPAALPRHLSGRAAFDHSLTAPSWRRTVHHERGDAHEVIIGSARSCAIAIGGRAGGGGRARRPRRRRSRTEHIACPARRAAGGPALRRPVGGLVEVRHGTAEATNPLLNPTSAAGCRVGQSGPVFFLVGTFPPAESVADRSGCTVPAHKALFFPLLNVIDIHVPGDGSTRPRRSGRICSRSGSAPTRCRPASTA